MGPLCGALTNHRTDRAGIRRRRSSSNRQPRRRRLQRDGRRSQINALSRRRRSRCLWAKKATRAPSPSRSVLRGNKFRGPPPQTPPYDDLISAYCRHISAGLSLNADRLARPEKSEGSRPSEVPKVKHGRAVFRRSPEGGTDSPATSAAAAAAAVGFLAAAASLVPIGRPELTR